MKETAPSRINAKVVLCKCPKNKRVYGMRIEQQGNDWVRTWAFKVDEERAKHEGFDTESTRGTMRPTPDYPGCPYCGGMGLAQCSCGKVFCWSGGGGTETHSEMKRATCPWCGQSGEYFVTEKINLQGGDL